jgi:hypothetical protein
MRGLRRFFAAFIKLDEADLKANVHANDGDSVVIWQSVSALMHPAFPNADAPVRVTAFGDGGSVAFA